MIPSSSLRNSVLPAISAGAVALLLAALSLSCDDNAGESKRPPPAESDQPAAVATETAATEKPVAPETTKPSRDEAALDQAFRLLRNKRNREARSILEPIVRENPDWGRAVYFLGLTYHKENRYEKAREYLAKALELEPDDDTIRVFYGWTLYYLGQLGEARHQFEAYLAKHPEYPEAHFAIALIEFDEDRLDESQRRLENAIEFSKSRNNRERMEGKARARLADIFIRKEMLEEARAELLKAVDLRPDAYEAYFKLSNVLHRLGDHEGAEEARRKYIEMRDLVQSRR